MEWEEWEPLYEQIIKEFGYRREEDERAALIASSLIRGTITPEHLKKLMEGKVVSICGAGENLTDELEEIEGVVMAADEATSVVLAHDIVPDIVTTDLDGNVDDIVRVQERGSIIIVHAHGDNMDSLKNHLPKFTSCIMLTTQSAPFNNVYNFGGFTDGDRAYCIARHFNASRIKLIGFDFENPKEKEGKNSEIKRKKLHWAKRIIEMQG
ncbi:MAG: hypothetical protein DRN21_00055 [Thermoplasmata archaeon]|nr:MAG: DUF115 domain-containing protein [Thermoplasmata archaeon]RLF33808.1 MAG: hypothetical protein DRN07_01555 [Thermoplasmata archaeon]RLF41475.1 MAG: hypothetical protein DRN21_00055 [Thermoplasmata archaeon]HDN50515.1 DUF115 domain-containing protein [Thermoplasmatales archaeon]